MPHKILFIETKPTLYGGQHALIARCKELDRREFCYTLIHPYINSDFAKQVSTKRISGFFVKPKREKWEKNIFTRSIFISFSILKIIRKYPPDIIHFDTFDSAYLAVILLSISRIFRIAKKPATVFTIRSERYTRFTVLDRCLIRKIDRLCTNSEFSRNAIANAAGINYKKITVTYTPIDFCALAQYRPKKSTKNNDLWVNRPFTVGYMGSFDRRKRLDRFIYICEKFCARFPNSDVRFVVYGTPKDNKQFLFLNNIRKRIKSNSLKNIDFLGYATIASAADNIDLLFCPFENEPLGRVVPEFLWFGIPVVIVNQGGLLEASCDEATVVNDMNDENELNKFLEFIRNSMKKNLVTEHELDNIRFKLKTKFGVKQVVDRELSVHRQLIGNSLEK